MVLCSPGRHWHFHPSLKGKETHAKHAATKGEKGSAWDLEGINRAQEIIYICIQIHETKIIIPETHTYGFIINNTELNNNLV